MKSFEEEYETKIESILSWFLPKDSTLVSTLKDKRDFGRKKYGEASFQLSKENSISVDSKTHALDEIVDLINYLCHSIYQETIKTNIDFIKVTKLKRMINMSIQMHTSLSVLIGEEQSK